MPATVSVLVGCTYEARLSPGPGVRSIPVPWDGRLQKLHREEIDIAALRKASDESLISSNVRLSNVRPSNFKFQTSKHAVYWPTDEPEDIESSKPKN